MPAKLRRQSFWLPLGVSSSKAEENQETRPRLESFLHGTQVQMTASLGLELLLDSLCVAGPVVNTRAWAGEDHSGIFGSPPTRFAKLGVTHVVLPPPRGKVETLPLTSSSSRTCCRRRPGNWDPAIRRSTRWHEAPKHFQMAQAERRPLRFATSRCKRLELRPKPG